MKDPKKISLLGLMLGAVALLASPAVHAQINTGIEFGSATGLAGGDIRTTIARIIQVFLGILGVVALLLIIYAGFLWMTAGGNEEKVAQAKKIMTQAVIGLIIVLSSFAITTFIISKLVEATGAGGGGGGNNGGGGGGGISGVTFAVESITPPGSKDANFKWPKNSQVRVVFKNGAPDPVTVPGSIAVSDATSGVVISGTVEASGNVLVFKATAKCVEDPSYTCLPGNSSFSVVVAPTLKSLSGADLFCGKCSAAFSTSDLIDTKPPTVSIASPVEGQSVSTAAFVPVIADASDDSAVAAVEFSANDVSLGSAGSEPWQIDWDTTGIPEGTTVVLKATATDAVGNTALAAPVTVTVRPAHCFNNVTDGGETGLNCGDGCGACGGDGCAANSDCASGLCQEGKCVNRPRIDSVTPLNGGPGTLVTIKGASFGSGPGEVLFLGTAAAGDEKVAAPCAPSAWSDTQVIVAVPEGAVTGALQLTNTSNYSDRTDDDFGNASIPNFTVDASVHPGICTLTPNVGPTGTSVEVSGNGFGDSQGAGSIAIASRSANVQNWSGTKITMTTPNLLGGIWPVTVTAAGNDSNSAAFNVPVSANTAPHLLGVEPDSGPVGEYVTLTGSNFGSSPGKVEFINGADVVLAGIDFPAACGNDFWRDSSVTVKVPAGLPLGEAAIKLTRTDAAVSDNALPFSIVAGTPSAGICRIAPSAGPVGTAYEIDGERLGNDRGKVVFRDKVNGATLLSSWNDSRISGAVPAGAISGGVYAVSADARVSNSLNFNVADCRKAQVCSGAEECCGDGACRLPNADGSSGCQAPKLHGSYRYRFSTGDIPLAPQVVEQITCEVRSQSPSPYKDVTGACANSVASVRFTVPMDGNTLTAANFKLFDCGASDAYDAANCKNEVTGAVSNFGGGQEFDDGMELAPGPLKPNEWYEGIVSKNVHSLAGVAMDADYVWNFRVRNSSDPCDIASVTVAPAVNSLTDLYTPETRATGKNITYTEYKAEPANEVCNLLDCAPYAWDWRTDQSAAVGIQNPSICTPEVQALSETVGAAPAQITATAKGKTGTGDITIKFAAPQVIDKWPACQEACLNAQVAASFNVPVKNVSPQTVKLFTCNNETCAAPIEAAGYTVEAVGNSEEHLVVIHPAGAALASNIYYRVVVIGGANGVHSASGAELIGTNYAYGAAAPAYSWVFRTSDKRCTVDRVNMSPARITTNVIGSYHTVSAVPISVPDDCSASGERLDGSGMDMVWSVDPAVPGAAELYANGTLNVTPLASNYATSACLNTGTVANLPVCGDGKVENGFGAVKAPGSEAKGGGEECDLGTNADGTTQNGVPGSGCTANCLLEGFSKDTCGNGKIDSRVLGSGQQAFEQCDLGARNGQPNSGCSSACLREGSDSTSPPSTCGNSDIADNEQCDDGNRVNGDGCSSICTDEGSLPGRFSVCGNGIAEAGEDCDLGANNGKAGSGCTASCLFTGTSACTAAGQLSCCGNGSTEAGEAAGCDLGWSNVNNRPLVAVGCDSSCRKTGSTFAAAPPSVCGDRSLGAGESIDPGSNDARVDGTQYAHSVGGGNVVDTAGKMVSKITATVEGKNGQAEFDLQCGFKSDSDCQRFGALALGSNSCCYPRPVVVDTAPRGANICRNTLIEAEFDKEMDATSFTAATFSVSAPAPAGGCPAAPAVSVSPFRHFLSMIRSFFARAIAFIVGKAAVAAPGVCPVPGAVTVDTRTMPDGTKHSFARFVLSVALTANTTYTATIDPAVKTVNGVAMGGSPVTWSFTTGSDICTLDAVKVAPDSALFGSVYVSGVDDPDSEATFVAQPVHRSADGSEAPIAPVPAYAWRIDWVSSDPSLINGIANGAMGDAMPANSATAKAGVKKAESGEAVLSANATVTADQLSATSTVGTTISGVSEVTVMLCKNPWPARQAVKTWRPAQNSKYNYSFYYCRDASSGETDLPDLKENPTSPSSKPAGVLDQYLYTYANTLAAEGIGIRVAQNPLHLSPTEWYLAQGFKGSVTSLTVDGYDAIREDRTVYVNAPALNVPSGGATISNYTNIYILSYTAGAGAETQDIFGQILKNFRFIANRDNNGNGNLIYNDQNFCAASPATVCASDFDCPSGSCLVQRSKIRRDVTRLADLRLIAEAVQRTRDSSGAYPALPSGSFVAGQSVSTWPSWAGEFAQEIGGKPPVDPLNKLAKCDDYSTDGTCWSSSKQAALCPIGSHVYRYMYPNNGIYYSFTPEALDVNYTFNCDGASQAVCQADPLCVWNGAACNRRFSNSCSGNTISAGPAVCGDGIIGPGEQCEKSVASTQTIACGNGSGREIDTCGNDCKWVAGSCQLSKCGNGIKEGNEVCDQGSANGTYGHCNAACTGIGQSCGDGIVQQGEACDLGARNGVYGSGCSFDCHNKGAYCGDGQVTNGEQCDGNSQTSADALPAGVSDTAGQSAACGVLGGYQTSRTQNCTASCGWDLWGPCLPAGSCGNGVKDGTEQCDNGVNNSDTGSCTKNCRLASCGDGNVELGVEQCDQGAGNIDPNDAAAITAKRNNCSLASCYYCSTSCTVKAISGGYCGDGIVNVNAGEQCDNGAANVDTTNLSYCAAANADACSICSLRCNKVAEPYCGDGIVNGSEGCDQGSQNGATGSSCGSTCQCLVETTISDAATRLVDASGNDLGPAVVQADAVASRFAPYWGAVTSAKFIWAFDESSLANDPAGWTSQSFTYYFKRTFTLVHPSQSVILQMTSDNSIDQVLVDGTDITNNVPGQPMNDKVNPLNRVYSLDISRYLVAGSSHTVQFKVTNYSNGYGTDVNPGVFAFNVSSYPNCGGQLSYAPFCGDGIVNGGEACDMGTALNDGAPGHCKSDCTIQTCAITDTLVTSNVAALSANVGPTTVTKNPDYTTGAVPVTDVSAMYGTNYDKLSNPSVQYVWSATATAPNDGVRFETEYFQQTFTLNCDAPAGTKFILHLNVDDDVNVYVNGAFIPPNPADTPSVLAGRTMSNLASPGYKRAEQYDVTQYINKTGTNTLRFNARNYYGPGLLAYWLETA